MNYTQVKNHFKTHGAIIDALGCQPARVSGWKKTGEIPLFRQWQIQLVTKGRLKAASLKDLPSKRPE